LLAVKDEGEIELMLGAGAEEATVKLSADDL